MGRLFYNKKFSEFRGLGRKSLWGKEIKFFWAENFGRRTGGYAWHEAKSIGKMLMMHSKHTGLLGQSILMRPNWKKLLLALAVIVPVVISWLAYQGLTYVETAENISSVSWLPEGATNVSYYKSYSFTAYEFDISEKGFQDWAAKYEQVQPIKEPFRIHRYTWRTVNMPPSSPATQEDREASDRIANLWEATIADGYFYIYSQSNGGGVKVAYDKKTKRAYFQSSPR